MNPFDLVFAWSRFWCRSVLLRFRHRHTLGHTNPQSFSDAIAALQLKMLRDPASPNAVDILGVESDFERPALEAAGSEKEVQICQTVGET